MRRIFVLLAVVALAVGCGPWAGSALAETTNETTNESIEAAESFEQRIDADTRIVSWEYSAGQFELEIEADEETTVALTEAGAFEEGTTTFNYDEVQLAEGTNTVGFQIRDRGTAGGAVAVATEQSLAQGTGAMVSTGQVEQNPFRHFGGESGLFTGVLGTLLMAALGSWYVVRSEESGVIEA